MPENIDAAENAFAQEIAPQSRPRDVAGKFVQTQRMPESMFSPREIEGDPETGDTSDGGDNKALRAREKELQREPDDDDVEDVESVPEKVGSVEPVDDDDEGAEEDEAGPKYEVVVDGEKKEVTLREALNGYVRQETFHKHLQQVNERNRRLDDYDRQLQANWQWWDKAKRDYEEDLANLIPKEPDWDREFADNPTEAYKQRKIFETLYGKLASSQQARANREQTAAQENDRRVQQYAVDGFTKFVMDNIKLLPDEPTLQKNLKSMRRTAAAAGFSDYEVATVYDPRMLTILLKASKYDRITANTPAAVVEGKGRTLTPGAATPLGNARRSGFDDAQRRLAQTGRMQDAVEVFRRML